MRYAVIDTAGLVKNVIELEEETKWSPPEGCTCLPSEDAEPGGTYTGTKFLPCPPDESAIDPDAVLATEIAKSTTLSELKAALLGTKSRVAVKGYLLPARK